MVHAKYLFEEELKKSGLTYVIHRPTGYFYDIIKVFKPMIEKGKVTLLGKDPIYANIKYVRVAVIDGNLPSVSYHLLLLLYGSIALGIGALFVTCTSQEGPHRYVVSGRPSAMVGGDGACATRRAVIAVVH